MLSGWICYTADAKGRGNIEQTGGWFIGSTRLLVGSSHDRGGIRTTAITHQSISLMLFVHQGMSAAPFCHLNGRSWIPVSGGTRDGGDASGPGLIYFTWWVRTAAVVWLALRASPPIVQTEGNARVNTLKEIHAKELQKHLELLTRAPNKSTALKTPNNSYISSFLSNIS